MLTTQRLAPPTCLERLNSVDQQMLLLFKDGQVPLEQVATRAGVDQKETLSAISRLIAEGCLELVILQYPWGIEFNLQLKGQAKEQFSEAHKTRERLTFHLVTS